MALKIVLSITGQLKARVSISLYFRCYTSQLLNPLQYLKLSNFSFLYSFMNLLQLFWLNHNFNNFIFLLSPQDSKIDFLQPGNKKDFMSYIWYKMHWCITRLA